MKKFSKPQLIFIYILLFTITNIAFNSCGGGTEPEDSTTAVKVTVEGEVIDLSTGVPIENAVVTIKFDTTTTGVTTNAQGKFSTQISIIGSKELKIITSKEGYKSDSTIAYALPGRITTVPTIKLQRTTAATPSGSAASITLYSQTATSLNVKESGGIETARITFEVQDSLGRAIDIDNAVTVKINKAAGPNGGEYLYPLSTKTNPSGLATFNLVSGIKAGVVQLIAEINLDTKVIKSKPVNITIHGGLPDSNHFSVAPEFLNFPGYNIFGLTNKITAYVGDKYGNPVRPETAVYFTTTGGIIEGSIRTNSQGQGTVNLISAEPQPVHPILGNGFATITATTADENNQIISSETIVLFSGSPSTMSITPTTFDLVNGASQNFNCVVADQNGNPLAPNTKITIEVEGDGVATQGEVDITMPDTQSKSWTTFSFSLYNPDDEKVNPRPISIKMKVSGPSGKNTLTISGTAR